MNKLSVAIQIPPVLSKIYSTKGESQEIINISEFMKREEQRKSDELILQKFCSQSQEIQKRVTEATWVSGKSLGRIIKNVNEH
jgi:hypothetical protein